jgi:hypothetical protein
MVALLVIAAVVALIAVFGVGYILMSGGDNTDAAPTPAPSSAPAATTTPVDESGCDGYRATPSDKTPAGWKSVVAKRGVAYDVPANWEVHSCTTLIGWEQCPQESDDPLGGCTVIRTMSGAASWAAPECGENQSQGMSGVPGAKSAATIEEALEQEKGSVASIYTSQSGVVPQVAYSPTRELKIGTTRAVQTTATVTGIEPDCVGSTALHSMLATTVEGQEGAVMFVISLPQGPAGTPDQKIIDQMLDTLRLAER